VTSRTVGCRRDLPSTSSRPWRDSSSRRLSSNQGTTHCRFMARMPGRVYPDLAPRLLPLPLPRAGTLSALHTRTAIASTGARAVPSRTAEARPRRRNGSGPGRGTADLMVPRTESPPQGPYGYTVAVRRPSNYDSHIGPRTHTGVSSRQAVPCSTGRVAGSNPGLRPPRARQDTRHPHGPMLAEASPGPSAVRSCTPEFQLDTASALHRNTHRLRRPRWRALRWTAARRRDLSIPDRRHRHPASCASPRLRRWSHGATAEPRGVGCRRDDQAPRPSAGPERRSRSGMVRSGSRRLGGVRPGTGG